MAYSHPLRLTDAQRQELLHVRNRAARSYVRKRYAGASDHAPMQFERCTTC